MNDGCVLCDHIKWCLCHFCRWHTLIHCIFMFGKVRSFCHYSSSLVKEFKMYYHYHHQPSKVMVYSIMLMYSGEQLENNLLWNSKLLVPKKPHWFVCLNCKEYGRFIKFLGHSLPVQCLVTGQFHGAVHCIFNSVLQIVLFNMHQSTACHLWHNMASIKMLVCLLVCLAWYVEIMMCIWF